MGCEHTRERQAVRGRRLAGAATARETVARGGCRGLMGAVLAIAVAGLGASPATAETIALGTFAFTGGGNATASGQSTSGATLTWGAVPNPARYDAGLFATVGSPGGYTFSTVGDQLTYTFTYSDITMGNTTSALFRTGFDFGSLAFLYHMTSIGTGSRLEFWANTDGVPFTTGTQQGGTIFGWSSSPNEDIGFATGNTIDATVSLTLAAIGTATYDYTYAVTYTDPENQTVTNTATRLFQNVAANTVDRIFHGGNNANIGAPNNAFTVSNASIVAVPEPGTAVAVVAGLMGLGLLRRRRVGG